MYCGWQNGAAAENSPCRSSFPRKQHPRVWSLRGKCRCGEKAPAPNLAVVSKKVPRFACSVGSSSCLGDIQEQDLAGMQDLAQKSLSTGVSLRATMALGVLQTLETTEAKKEEIGGFLHI